MQLTELRPTLLSMLEREDALPDAPKIWHTLALYCCRLIGRSQFRVWIYSTYSQKPQLRDSLLELKDRLDLNSLPNRVLRAVVDLAKLKRRPRSRYEQIARSYGLSTFDLRALERSLTKSERALVRKKWPRGVGKELSQRVKENLVKHYEKVTRYLVYRYLSYVYNNDRAIYYADLCADMDAEVTRLAMHYEVFFPLYYTEERFLRSIHCGLNNHVMNVAKQYGRKSRCGVERDHRAASTRKLWYLSKAMKVHNVVVSMKQEARRSGEDGLETMALFRDGSTKWIPITSLYSTRADATLARFQHQQDCAPANRVLPSLAPHDIDNFRLTSRSLDAVVTDEGKDMSLYSVTSSPQVQDNGAKAFLVDLSRSGASQALQDFAKIVIGDYHDQVFSKWLHVSKGKDVGTMTPEQIGHHAAKWVGSTIKQLREDVTSTAASMWGNKTIAVLAAFLNNDQ